jgi:hypothetical protein
MANQLHIIGRNLLSSALIAVLSLFIFGALSMNLVGSHPLLLLFILCGIKFAVASLTKKRYEGSWRVAKTRSCHSFRSASAVWSARWGVNGALIGWLTAFALSHTVGGVTMSTAAFAIYFGAAAGALIGGIAGTIDQLRGKEVDD